MSNPKYKVFDGTVIFPPAGAYDFNDYFITVHILLKSNGINTENINKTCKNLMFITLLIYPIPKI